MSDTSFQGKQWWWSSYYPGSYSNVRFEIWSAKPGDPKPFDQHTMEKAPLGTEQRKAIAGDNNVHSIRWSGASLEKSSEKELKLRLNIDDQMWIRLVFPGYWSDETFIDKAVPRQGILGLDWFYRIQTLNKNEQSFEVIVRLKEDKELKIPPVLQEVFNN